VAAGHFPPGVTTLFSIEEKPMRNDPLPLGISAFRAVIGTLLFCSAACFSTFSRAAQAFDGSPSQVVRYADLDITTATGTEALYQRIVAAAHAVCLTPLLAGHWSPAAKKACVDRAVSHAVASSGLPRLTRLHEAHLVKLAGR
jgi:UrcA family protein